MGERLQFINLLSDREHTELVRQMQRFLMTSNWVNIYWSRRHEGLIMVASLMGRSERWLPGRQLCDSEMA